MLLPGDPTRTVCSLPTVRGVPAKSDDHGMSTAEYAIGTATACAFAAALYLILTSDQVSETLTQIVTDALQIAG